MSKIHGWDFKIVYVQVIMNTTADFYRRSDNEIAIV